MHILKKHSQINWTLADQAIVSGVNFLTGILIARYLGAEEFGRFTLVWMAVLFVNSIQMAMISNPMLSIAPKQEKKNNPAYFSAIILQQFIFGLLSFCLVYGGVHIYHFWKPEHTIISLSLPLALAVFSFQTQDFLRRLFFAQTRPAIAFINDFISYIGQLALLVYLFQVMTLDTEKVLWVISITSLAAIFFGVCCFRNLANPLKQFTCVIKRHWASAKWMTLSALLQWFSGNIFFIMTGVILGSSAVGALKATQNLLAGLNIIFLGLDNYIPLKMSYHFHNNGLTKMKYFLMKILFHGLLIIISISCFISFFSSELLAIFFNGVFDDYVEIVYWWAAIYPVMYISMPIKSAFRAMEKTNNLFYSVLISLVFSILFSGFLIENYGLRGTMIGILSVHIIISFFYTRKIITI